MGIIKYKADFKRILTFAIQEKGKVTQIRVGEVNNFQQNIDGTLDIVAWIWPQTPKRIQEMIEKNPGLMGMTSETKQVTDHIFFPDGTNFDEVEKECDHEFVSTFNQKGEANPYRICVKCCQHT